LHRKVTTDKGANKSISSKLRRGALNWEPRYREEDEASMERHKQISRPWNGERELLTKTKYNRA